MQQSAFNSIPPEQREKALTLVALVWHFSGKPQGNLTINHYDALAEHIENEIEITCSGKSIKNLTASLEKGSLEGFKRNTTKETLAGYLLVKAGVIDQVEVVRDPRNLGINHPVHKYWRKFEEHYDEFKNILPPGTTTAAPELQESPLDNFPFKPVLSYYEGTKWMVYSRSRTGGIYRHILVIEKGKNARLNRAFMINGSTRVEDYVGFVGMDSGQGYLIFNLVTQESGHKHLHIKMKVSRGALPTFATSQVNFISTFSNVIMSDANLFVLVSKDSDEEAVAKHFLPGAPDYLELPLCLRRYFARPDCRIVTPEPDFVNIRQFEEWLEDQYTRKEPDKILSMYCDDYAVFYQTIESTIEEHSIRIYLDRNVEEIHAAVATDYRDEFRKTGLYRCENTITLFLAEAVGWEDPTYYLSFKIPLQAKDTEPYSFEGIVSGFWQGLNGAAGRALVVKKSWPDFQAKVDRLLGDFFMLDLQFPGQQ